MKRFLLICVFLSMICLATSGVLAVDAHVFTDTSDNVLLTIGTDGSGNFTGDVMENGIKLSDTYCALTGGCVFSTGINITGDLNVTGDINFGGTIYGDGSGLTGVTVSLEPNSTVIAYQNISNIPTCGAGTFLAFDGTDLSCQAVPDDSVNIDAANVTAGVFDIARIPVLINATTVSYHNITDIPTCSGTDVLSFDGTDLSCVAQISLMNYTNIAMTNQSNTFTPQQTFSGGIVSADNITIADTKLIEWTGGGSISASSGVITYKAGV